MDGRVSLDRDRYHFFLVKKTVRTHRVYRDCAPLYRDGGERHRKTDHAIATGYDLWYLPLHFSSTFYITVGVSVFAHGKAEHAAQTILFVGGIIMCAMILVRPAAILGNLSGVFTSHIHAHGYFYHMLVVLQFGIMLARGNYRPKRHDPLFFAGGVALWGAVAIPCAFVFNANYMGILHAYIPFLEQFRIKFGYAPYLIVYYLGAVLLATLLIYGYGFLRKKLAKKA